MFNNGVFEIIAQNGQTPVTGSWPNGVVVYFNPINLQLTRNARWLEIINKSPYDLAINFIPGGAIVQEDGSKCIYAVAGSEQNITIQPQPIPSQVAGAAVAPPLTNILLTPPNNVIIVNSYNEDEIQWYPPVSLNAVVQPIQQTFGYLNYQTNSSNNVTTGAPLAIAASTSGAQTFLIGFDATVSTQTTSEIHLLKLTGIISNFFQNSNNQLVWQIYTNSTNASILVIKFPTPVLIQSGTAQFAPSVNFASANIAINAYWIVQ